jgi:hypothetical protein
MSEVCGDCQETRKKAFQEALAIINADNDAYYNAYRLRQKYAEEFEKE